MCKHPLLLHVVHGGLCSLICRASRICIVQLSKHACLLIGSCKSDSYHSLMRGSLLAFESPHQAVCGASWCVCSQPPCRCARCLHVCTVHWLNALAAQLVYVYMCLLIIGWLAPGWLAPAAAQLLCAELNYLLAAVWVDLQLQSNRAAGAARPQCSSHVNAMVGLGSCCGSVWQPCLCSLQLDAAQQWWPEGCITGRMCCSV